MEKPWVCLEQATVMLRGKKILPNTSWNLHADQNWAIIGPNGSGKSSLCRVILGELPVCQGRLRKAPALYLQNAIAYVSFGIQQKLLLKEDREDAARAYRGTVHEMTTIRELLLSVQCETLQGSDFEKIVRQLQIQPLLDRGLRALSNGEMRRVMLARGLLKAPRLLILDEPFDGLDAPSRLALAEIIDSLMAGGLKVLLVTHRLEEITANITHVLCLKDCKVFAQGNKSQMLASDSIQRLYEVSSWKPEHKPPLKEPAPPTAEPLIEMRNVRVKYGEKIVLNQLNWTVKRGENWAIVGPNGAGKSTLLRLISADNLQAYANEIYLFGKKRGTGESIWEIKKKIGLVSAEFQLRYHSAISARQVILSGFFDSIGLYQRGSDDQQSKVEEWIEVLGLEEQAQSPFNLLSQGQQRVVLLARAMVKSPRLLILDEPCQGLDAAYRKRVLELVDFIGQHTDSQLLYVTHHLEEQPACIHHVLRFEPTADGFYQAYSQGNSA